MAAPESAEIEQAATAPVIDDTQAAPALTTSGAIDQPPPSAAASAPASPSVMEVLPPMPQARDPQTMVAAQAKAQPVIAPAAGAAAPMASSTPGSTAVAQPAQLESASDWPADCEEHHRFMAHSRSGSASPRHTVPAGTEQVMNFYFEQPWQEARQLLKSRFLFDNTKLIHHWALFVTSAKTAPGTIINQDNLFEAVNLLGVQFFLGGGANNSELELPPDVGLRVPQVPTPGFWLQIHYVNVTDTPQEDASGVELCLTSKPRAHEAAVHALGKSSFELPAKTQSTVSSTCRPNKQSSPVHVVAISPHMHATGRRATISVNRSAAAPAPVFDQPFDAHEQRNYVVPSALVPEEIVISPGDTVTTHCHYDNDTNALIPSGSLSDQEMCLMLVWAWPAGQLNNGQHSSPELGVPTGEDCTER